MTGGNIRHLEHREGSPNAATMSVAKVLCLHVKSPLFAWDDLSSIGCFVMFLLCKTFAQSMPYM